MKTIIISRTDGIGDVVLTLPVAGALKQAFPDRKILFLGRSYTRPVIEVSGNVDVFLDWDEIRKLPAAGQAQYFRDLHADAILHVFPRPEVMKAASKAGIPVRIGTAFRRQSWIWCNRRVFFSRKRSRLHEALLNMKLLKPLGIQPVQDVKSLTGLYGLREVEPLVQPGSKEKKIVILHPCSKGSAREWGLDNYSALVSLLPSNRYDIYITGTQEEGSKMKGFLEANQGRVTDVTGKLSLPELIRLIRGADALVAASTGPLHIAAALGIRAIGLYAPIRPIFPERWAPLGAKASFFVKGSENCGDCRKSGNCHCIREITPEEVAGRILS